MASGGKGGSSSQITGYQYYMAVQFGLGRGPANELTDITVGDIPAWNGSIVAGGFDEINQPYLFGGDQKEGGIVGTFRVFMGESTQVIDEVVKDNIEGSFPVPGWRGVVTVFYYGQISSNNPYPKPWKFRLNRTTAGWNTPVFQPSLAMIPMSSTPLTLVTFNVQPLSGNTLLVGEVQVAFFTAAPDSTNVTIGADAEATASNFASVLNFNSSDLYDVVATASGAIVTLVFPSSVIVQQDSGTFASVTNQGGAIKAMNAAHIIYQCATDPVWGRGMPASLIDETSFTASAQTLYDEGFGLCLKWNRQEDIDVFVSLVLQHVAGAVYINRRTGLLTFTLTRDDYDIAGLPEFTFENGIIDITEDEISSSDTSYNEIIVTYLDPISNKKGAVRAQNLASFQSLGSIISQSEEYLGLPTGPLASRVAQRDLQINSSDIRRMKLKFGREAWFINPNDVFKISIPQRGIASMVLRAVTIEESSDQTITISCVQDIFGLPATSFVTPQPSYWVPPDKTPRIIDPRLVDEMTYYDLSQTLPQATLDTVEIDNGFTKIFAMQPTGVTVDYVVSSKTTTETNYQDRNVAGFDATATVKTAFGLHDTDIEIENGKQLGIVGTSIPVLIAHNDDHAVQEYAELTAFDATAGTATITRGCIDTIPHSFEIGDRIWFQTHLQTSDVRSYSTSEEVEIKLLSRTSSARLDPSLAPTDTIEIGGRQGRPYPPGKLEINGDPFEEFQILTGDIVLTWTHRDRIVEGNHLLGHEEASTGPESGTTYTVRVYDGDGVTLLRTASSISGTTYTYDSSMAAADGGPSVVWMELESVRDSLASWQHYRFKVTLNAGFGFDFGFNFGGGV